MPEGIPGGYTGKILRVNLSNHKISIDTPDAAFYRKHLGGAGFVFHFLHALWYRQLIDAKYLELKSVGASARRGKGNST